MTLLGSRPLAVFTEILTVLKELKIQESAIASGETTKDGVPAALALVAYDLLDSVVERCNGSGKMRNNH